MAVPGTTRPGNLDLLRIVRWVLFEPRITIPRAGQDGALARAGLDTDKLSGRDQLYNRVDRHLGIGTHSRCERPHQFGPRVQSTRAPG